MSTEFIDMVFDVVASMFWMRMWVADERDLFFNPYLGRVARITDAILDPVRHTAPVIPQALAALVACAAVLVLRGVMVCYASQETEIAWAVRFGFIRVLVDTSSIVDCLTLSACKFLVFLFNVWCVATIYIRSTAASSYHAAALVYHAGKPITSVPDRLRPLVLLPAGVGLSMLILAALAALPDSGTNTPGLLGASVRENMALLAGLAISTVAAFVQVLPAISTALVVFVIGSWISAFSGSHALAATCRDWMDFLMGGLRAWPIRIGMIDLTPLVLIVAINWITPFVLKLLEDAARTVSP